MNKFFSFFAASNRYKHLIGGFIVATLAGSFYAAIYAAAVAASCLEQCLARVFGTCGTGLTGSAPFSAASSQHSCFTSYSQWYGTKGFLKTTKIA